MRVLDSVYDRCSGLTLPEVVVALAISTLIMVSLQSTVNVAIKCVPSQSGPVQKDVAAARFLRQMESELENCTRIIGHDPQSVTFLVADRNGDGTDEKIRYEFSSATGDFIRTYNSESPVTLLSGITEFSIGFDTTNCVYKVSGPIAAQSVEVLNQATNSGSLELIPNVNTGTSVGMYLVPSTANEKLWRPTQLRAKVRRISGSSGVDLSILPAMADGTPASARHISDTATYNAASLPSSYSDGYISLNTPNAPWIGSGKPLALTVSRSDSANAGSFAKVGNGENYLYTLLGSWIRSNSLSLEYQLYGQRGNSASSYSLNFPIFSATRIQFQTAPSRTPVYGGCNLNNGVGNIGIDYKLNFDSSPLQADDNCDGNADWQLASGSITGSDIASGRWTANNSSVSLVENSNINQIGIIDIDWRCVTSLTSEGFVSLNCFRNGTNACPLRIVMRKESDNCQYLTLLDTSTTPAKQIFIAPGLSQDDITIRLLFDPNAHSIVLLVNDTEQANFTLGSANVSQSLPAFTIGSSSGAVQFDSIRLRVWNP
jgi:hypothetical protein